MMMMMKKIALAALLASPLLAMAANEQPHEQALPRVTAATAAAPATAVAAAPASAASAAKPFVQHRTASTHQHQLAAECKKKVDATGATGPAHKKAMLDCMKAS